MGFLEYLYYESLPYFYAGLGVFALEHGQNSHIAVLAGVVLVLCSLFILNQRYQYRTFKNNKRRFRL